MDSNRQLQKIFHLAFPNEKILGESQPNYWAIHGPNGLPRWIIPQDPRVGLPVLTKWHPFQMHSRIKWAILISAYRLGVLSRFSNICPVHIKAINWYGLENMLPVFYVGTPSNVSKLVISLVNTFTYQPISVLKVPIGCNAGKNILHEAAILSQLAAYNIKCSPAILATSLESGQTLQEAIIGEVAGASLTENHFQVLLALQRSGQYLTLTEQQAQLDAKMQRVELNEIEHTVYDKIRVLLASEAKLPMFWCHGDFSPWNVLESKKGIKLVDWERSQPSGLPLQDLFHFLSQQHFLQGKLPQLELQEHILVKKYLKKINLNISAPLLKKLLLYYMTDNWLNACWEESALNRQLAFQSMVACMDTIQ